MEPKLTQQISTGPLDQEWLVAEIYCDDELICELLEWGEKLVIYPRQNGEPWTFPANEFLEIVRAAKERVRLIPDNQNKE